MKQFVLLVILFLSTQAHALREVQNGGGGMRSDAGIETFLSAKMYLSNTPEEPQHIPGLARLMAELAAMPIKESIKGKLIAGIYPTLSRNYFRVNDDEIDVNTRSSIIEKYANMTRIPESKVVLLAASGSASQTTVLFKEFYQLKEHEQAAILFHEALWILSPELTYENVVAVEQDAQTYFQNHNDRKTFYKFCLKLSNIFGDNNFYLFPMLNEDFKSGVFQKSANGAMKISLVELFGKGYLDSMLRHDFTIYKLAISEIDYVRATNQVIAYHAALMSAAKPESLYYQALLQYQTRFGFITLLPAFSNTGHMHYSGFDSQYEEYRDGLYVVIPDQLFGDDIYLEIYDNTDIIVGRLLLKK